MSLGFPVQHRLKAWGTYARQVGLRSLKNALKPKILFRNSTQIYGIVHSCENGYTRQYRSARFLAAEAGIEVVSISFGTVLQPVLHRSDDMNEALWDLPKAIFTALRKLLQNSQLIYLQWEELEDWQALTRFNVEEGIFPMRFPNVPSSISDMPEVRTPPVRTMQVVELDENGNGIKGTAEAYPNLTIMQEVPRSRSVPLFRNFRAPAVCRGRSNSLCCIFLVPARKGGPELYATASAFKSNRFQRARGGYSRGTVVVKPLEELLQRERTIVSWSTST